MPRLASSAPILPVADLAAASMFYAALGFEVAAHDAGYGLVLRDGREVFHLRRVEGLDRVANPAALYLHVDDADAWQAAWAGGPADVGEVADQPWGMREFSLRDPDGNLIRVGHNL